MNKTLLRKYTFKNLYKFVQSLMVKSNCNKLLVLSYKILHNYMDFEANNMRVSQRLGVAQRWANP